LISSDPERANRFTWRAMALFKSVSAAAARAKIDREAEAFDGVPADRLAPIQRTPRRVVGTGEDVPLHGFDRLVIAQAE